MPDHPEDVHGSRRAPQRGASLRELVHVDHLARYQTRFLQRENHRWQRIYGMYMMYMECIVSSRILNIMYMIVSYCICILRHEKHVKNLSNTVAIQPGIGSESNIYETQGHVRSYKHHSPKVLQTCPSG